MFGKETIKALSNESLSYLIANNFDDEHLMFATESFLDSNPSEDLIKSVIMDCRVEAIQKEAVNHIYRRFMDSTDVKEKKDWLEFLYDCFDQIGDHYEDNERFENIRSEILCLICKIYNVDYNTDNRKQIFNMVNNMVQFTRSQYY